MSVPFLSPSKTVMMISDEFISLYSVGARSAKLIEIFSWNTENFLSSVSKALSKVSGGGSVLIVNDMVEQHYRKERVMKAGVNVLDRSAIIKRKLNAAFPSYPVRAAYALKEKAPQAADKKGASDIYIFAAVADSDQLKKTSDVLRFSSCGVSGFCLLPVEASSMVSALSAKLTRKGVQKPVWSVFIGQHRNGNLRQVVTKNGELALTRMSPIMDRDDNPEAWASELYQEFKSTMGYLTRFGYEPTDGLDVMIIANPGAGEVLSGMVEEECALHILSAGEAAETLGLSIGRQDNGRYADSLHVSWIARKSKLLLPMDVPQIEAAAKPRKFAKYTAAVLVCGLAFLGYQTFSSASALHEKSKNIQQAQADKAKLTSEYEAEVQKLNALGFDVQLVQSSILITQALEKQKIDVLALVHSLGKGLGKDLRVDSVDLQRFKPLGVAAVVDQNKPQPLYEARLKMTYPPDADVDKGNQEVADLSARIQAVMPNAEVRVAKALKDYAYTEGLVVKAGDLEKENLQQDFIAEIVIRGQIPPLEHAQTTGGTP